MEVLWYTLDENRVPVPCDDIYRFAAWMSEGGDGAGINPKAVVGKADFTEVVHVSTVFLGLDHSMGRSNQPILFETMIFGGPFDGYQRRYATWEEAEKGHAEACEQAGRVVPLFRA